MTFIHARVHEVDIQVIQKLQQLAEVFDSINIRVDYWLLRVTGEELFQ